MYFSKSLVALAIVASGFAAVAGKTNAKNRKCTFYCRGQGVCAVVLKRDPVGAPSVTTGPIQRTILKTSTIALTPTPPPTFVARRTDFHFLLLGRLERIRGDLVDRKCREPTDQDPHLPAGCR
ncbi:hypothetical protein H4Q26_003785 [Puccinia striiformis f. sp. tritici PST-130]|nr:hypothetical protein H4Q26_003785 [Puccinia striiformis f. sp. tritici PST-130]